MEGELQAFEWKCELCVSCLSTWGVPPFISQDGSLLTYFYHGVSLRRKSSSLVSRHGPCCQSGAWRQLLTELLDDRSSLCCHVLVSRGSLHLQSVSPDFPDDGQCLARYGPLSRRQYSC